MRILRINGMCDVLLLVDKLQLSVCRIYCERTW